jgi:putative DNA primase/helicase
MSKYLKLVEGKKYSAKDPDMADTPEFFEDAGRVIESNEIVVDIDNVPRETIEGMVQMFNIGTEIVWTDRGAHLWFQRPDGKDGQSCQGRPCALGFKIEKKTEKNRACCVKRNGVLRKVENPGVREEMPKFFSTVKKFEELIGFGEGGRNNILFQHRQRLANMPNWKNILRFANNYLFDEPLEEKEFQVLVRDGVTLTASKDMEPLIAEDLVNRYGIVKYKGQKFFRDKSGEFITGDDLEARMIVDNVGHVKMRYLKEIMEQINIQATLVTPDKGFVIRFENGILKDGKFYEVEYTDFTPYKINVPYNPDAEPVQMVDDYIHMITQGEPEYRQLLCEILGSTLVVKHEFKRVLAKFFIFIGDGGNGKGTLLNIIEEILGADNVSTISPKELTKEQYLYGISDKLANLADDIDNVPFNDEIMKRLKNISTCDKIELRKLFEQSTSCRVTASLIMASNHLLKSFEKGESFRRRVCWLPMYGKPKKKDPLFITKLTTEAAREYWVKLMVEGYLRLYAKEGVWTESALVKEFNSNYHLHNNPCLVWVKEQSAATLENRTLKEAWDDFQAWQEETDNEGGSKTMLKETIIREFNMDYRQIRKSGHKPWVFLKREIVSEQSA